VDDTTATTHKAQLPPGFWTIWTTVALDLVGFGIVAPILGRYAERFGASGLEVGLLFASFSLAQFVFSPILGRVSDRVGRKPVIIVSLIGTAVGSFVTGAAGALWVLFLGRIIDGASGASVAVAQSAITDIAPPDQRTKLLGMLGAAFGIGFVLGPAVGGLAALGGPHVPFYVAGTVAAVNAVLAFIRLPETKSEVAPAARSSRTVTRVVSPELFRFAVVGFIATAGFAGFEATFSLFGERRFDLTEGSAAAVFLFVGALLVVVQGLLIGKLAARVHPFTLLRGALLVVAVGLFALSTATTWPLLFISLAVLAFGQGVATPSLTSLVAEAAPAERRGEALGYQQSAGALARIVGPVVAGAIFDGVGVGAPYVLGGVLVLVALGIVSFRQSQKISVT
jgi:multidrug resistance protein